MNTGYLRNLFIAEIIDSTAVPPGSFSTSIKIFLKNIWQNEKNNFIFALQKLFINKKNMLRTILHIEAVNWFSPKGYDTISGACIADS